MDFLNQFSLYDIFLVAFALIVASIIRIIYDTQKAKRKFKALNELVSVYNVSMNTSDNAIIIISEHDEIIFANKEAHRLLQTSTDTLSTSYLNTEVKIHLPNTVTEHHFLHMIEEKKSISNAQIVINKISLNISATIHFFKLPSENTSVGFWRILTIKDRKHDIQLQKKIEQTGLSQDIRTDLPLKHHLPGRLLSVILNTSKTQNQAALGMIGISDYHEIQKSHGFDKLDILWKSISNELSKTMKENESLYHFDHDSFAIIFHNMQDKQIVHNRLDHCKSIIKNILLREHIKTEVLSSIYYIARPYPTVEKAINQCLYTLYSKKISKSQDTITLKSSGNNIKEPSQNPPRLLEKKDFEIAIKNNDFFFFYQPIYDLKKGRLIGVEALTRLNHKKDGLLFPDTFLEQAIEYDMMTEVTTHLLDSVLSQKRFWSTQTQKEFTTTINLSIADVRSGIFTETLEKKLFEYEITPSTIIIDISEEILEEDFKAVFEECYILNKLGVKLTIDHFGKNSVNLIQISNLPLYAIKLDGSIVDTIAVKEEKIRLVSGIISMGKKLGIEVGATFIDSEVTKTLLSRVMCDFGQGNYLGKAMSAFEIMELLREQ
jgi:EAL domain-containing protein (putative c-di-GMP-specific phosphodiesterase class I)/GGDEF domain-containing protein